MKIPVSYIYIGSLAFVLIYLSNTWYWPINRELDPLMGYKIYGALFDNIMYILCIVTVLARFAHRNKAVRFSKEFALLLGLIFLSALVSGDFIDSFKSLIRIIIISLFIFTIVEELGAERIINTVLSIFIIIVIVNFLSIIFFHDLSFMAGMHNGSAKGLLPHKNGFGFLMVIAFTIIFSIEKKTIFINIVLIMSVIMVLLSKSSTAIILLFVSFSLYTYLYTKARLLSGFAINFIVIFVFLFFWFFSQFFIDGILELFGKSRDLTGRQVLWDFYVGAAQNEFWFGLGSYIWDDSFKSQFKLSTGIPVFYTPHNSYLATLISYGIFVSILYFYIMGKPLLRFFRDNGINVVTPLYCCLPILLARGGVETGSTLSVSIYFCLLLILWSLEFKDDKDKFFRGE
jgi:exopolysaccharide production protein ExoQ